MANKKKIEERREAERKARQARYVQIAGVAVTLLVIVLGFWYFSSTAPAAEEPITAGGPPPMTIDTAKTYYATFTLEKGGEFVIELFDDQAPITVNNFVTLARRGFYDGTIFHRVIEGFMAQGGDPTGTGTGGPGYSFEDEFGSGLTFDRPGLLAMANSGPNTNGSQFFITFVETPHLNNRHTIFGEVIEGMEVVNGITRREPGSAIPGDVIETITITEE
jgi:cyclophilin family peptidyl-prolyl cis-trans isomerase